MHKLQNKEIEPAEKVTSPLPSPEEIKKMTKEERVLLAKTLRERLIESVAATGGHLASNLGIVELTIALHSVFDSQSDRFVFDVGHQGYIHKMLTGRESDFKTLRQFGGLSGFPKPAESCHDAFITGHASTSISVGLGLLRAARLQGDDSHVISIIGDGSLTGGLAYEGLNDSGASGLPLIVILNDNGMAISENVGAMAGRLGKLRMQRGYTNAKSSVHKIVGKLPGGRAIEGLFHNVKEGFKHILVKTVHFESFGYAYFGPYDGHNIENSIAILKMAKEYNRPVLLHFKTVKGKGYPYSEQAPDFYHGISAFDPEKGLEQHVGKETFSSVAGKTLCALAAKNPDICAITAAMPGGTGLTEFGERFPSRFFDTGITEGHAVTMAAAMAEKGALPVCAIYSTFLQRSYDQLIHDVAIAGNKVILLVDRAGLVGEDGETHHGVFDVAYLSQIPRLQLFAVASLAELQEAIAFAASVEVKTPVAIRYQRGGEGTYTAQNFGKTACLQSGEKLTVVTYGTMINPVLEAANGLDAEVLLLSQLAPLNPSEVLASVAKTGRLLVAEEVNDFGCIGRTLLSELALQQIPYKAAKLQNLGSGFMPHGTNKELYKKAGLDAKSLKALMREMLSCE